MYRLRVVDNKTVLDEGLLEIIVEFDKKNMADVHRKTNAPLDEEIRRRNITQNGVFILAFTVDERLAGYLEYGQCQKNGEEMFITSMKIDRRHRQSILISQILLQAKRDLLRRSFKLQ
jgi:hypothetical protein